MILSANIVWHFRSLSVIETFFAKKTCNPLLSPNVVQLTTAPLSKLQRYKLIKIKLGKLKDKTTNLIKNTTVCE